MSEDAAKRIRKALLRITEHYDDALVPSRRAAGSHVLTGKVDAPMPISADILDKRRDCRERMASACLMVINTRDLHTEHLSGFEVPAMADLLQRHSAWIGTHTGMCWFRHDLIHTRDAAVIIAWELEASAKDLGGIVAPYHRDWQPLGKCPLLVDSEDGPVVCGGEVRAHPDADTKCEACGVEGVTSWWEKVMFDDPELTRLLTAPELVIFVHNQFGKVVGEVTIRKWIERGIITRAGSDDKGRTLFDKGAVAYAITRRKMLA